jgi:alkylation response protein AidB-like acyl-CoA dehydrogenase
MSADREILDDASRRFTEDWWPLERVRSRADGEWTSEEDQRAVREYLRQAGALGWFANFVDEKHGGGSVSGHPVRDAVAIGLRRGALLQPGAWVSTNLAADALTRFGTNDQRQRFLEPLVSADLTVSWLADTLFGTGTNGGSEANGVSGTGAVSGTGGVSGISGVVAERHHDGFRISGASLAVEAAACDFLYVSARLADNQRFFLVPFHAPGIEVLPLDGIDLSRSFHTVSFHDVALADEAMVGDDSTAPEQIDRAVALAAVLASSQTVGAMASLFSMTVDYARDRVAFGRPIGAFQAIKHQLADLSLRLECGRAILRSAAMDLDEGARWAGEVASIVKAFVADSATVLAQGCLQIHGGIGFTWEHDLHLYYRRLAADAALGGDAAWHRERLCALHEI